MWVNTDSSDSYCLCCKHYVIVCGRDQNSFVDIATTSTHQSFTMCYHQTYQLWGIILILFLLLDLCSTVCYHGTCDVECHCQSDSDCHRFDGEYTDQLDVCRSECRSGWEGIGCQFGNVAEGKIASQIDWSSSSFRGDNSPGNCVDGSGLRREEQDTCCAVEPERYWELFLRGMYVVNQLKLHRSDNAPISVRDADIGLYNDDQLVLELSTGSNDPPGVLTFYWKEKYSSTELKCRKNQITGTSECVK